MVRDAFIAKGYLIGSSLQPKPAANISIKRTCISDDNCGKIAAGTGAAQNPVTHCSQ